MAQSYYITLNENTYLTMRGIVSDLLDNSIELEAGSEDGLRFLNDLLDSTAITLPEILRSMHENHTYRPLYSKMLQDEMNRLDKQFDLKPTGQLTVERRGIFGGKSVVKAEKKDIDAAFLKYSNEVQKLKDSFFESIAEFEYRGVDLTEIRFRCLSLFSMQEITMLAIIVALRGPGPLTSQKADSVRIRSLTVGENGKTLSQMIAIVRSNNLTLQRIGSAFADVATFGLIRLHEKGHLRKRFDNLSCPAYLQWLGASSVPLSPRMLQLHKEFCREFANRLPANSRGKTFNEQLYDQIQILPKPHLSESIVNKIRARIEKET